MGGKTMTLGLTYQSRDASWPKSGIPTLHHYPRLLKHPSPCATACHPGKNQFVPDMAFYKSIHLFFLLCPSFSL